MAQYDFHIIAIGSSAGGFDPLKTIVSDISADINAAVVVIQHFPADEPSNMDVLLQKFTQLKVVAVETIEYVEAGNVYVMAAGKQLVLKDHTIQVEERHTDDKVNRTIDRFFKTLAKDAGNKAVGVILSGAGYDGLEGAKAIEDAEGLIIVQDPITADFPLMPQTLIANDHPDYVLKPQDIHTKILDRVGNSR